MSFYCLYLCNAYDIIHIQVHTPVMLIYGLLILPAVFVLNSAASLVYVMMYNKELILFRNETKK